ncbi:MAG: SRPBCC family protein [Actinomycetota bacterium]|nr:SRPBCC family protein [Actinomycetota bacterium]
MSVVTVSVEVDAPAEQVWEAISDPRNLPQWDRHIARVEGVPATGLRAGMRYVTEMRCMGVRAKIRVQVLEWDPPRRAKFQLRGVLEGTVASTVEPLGPDRSRLEHVVDYRFKGGPIGALAARSLRLVGGARFALRHGTLAQKREIEQRSRG